MVPPLTASAILPLAAPLQVTFVPVAVAVKEAGSVMAEVLTSVQPLLSVMVTE